MKRRRVFSGFGWMFVAILGLGVSSAALAQANHAATPQKNVPAETAAADPDGQVVMVPERPQSRAELAAAAWKMLEDSLGDDKHPDAKSQALSALGTMGSNARAGKMIVGALTDKDVDIRTAAVLAAGQTKNRALLPEIRTMLDDREPHVAFTAASTLWKMGDHSGKDLLEAVVDGDRAGNAGLVHGSMHQASKELHDPTALAKLGAMQGAEMLLGPFGFGITAYEYVRRNGGGNSPRVTAIKELEQMKTPAVRKEMLGAVTDKDPGVRTAAAKALRSYHDAEVQKALSMLFQDPKKPVQLVGAASYLISVGEVAVPVETKPGT